MENNKEENKELNNKLRTSAFNHKQFSLDRLDVSFMKHINAEEYKKSHLLAYWFTDFANYHDDEKTFDTTKLITFKRGHIIKANLGFNVGKELGGLHYCIVLNKNDNPKNGALNVIPLTSKKDKKYPQSSIYLGNEIYDIVNKIYSEKQQYLSEKYADIWNLPPEKVKEFTEEFAYIRKVKAEIENMKIGSVALIEQITTISKQRIYDDDVLKNVRLSSTSLDLIDEKIIKYFTKNK